MALIHNALRPGKVRFRPMVAREAGAEILVRFSCCWGSPGLFTGSSQWSIGVLLRMSVMLDLAAFEGNEAGRPVEVRKKKLRASGGTADALASGASVRKGVGVQIPPRARKQEEPRS